MECKVCGEALRYGKAILLVMDSDVAITSILCPKCQTSHDFSFRGKPRLMVYDKEGKEI